MREITIVERGEYADHVILAAFELQSDAERFAEDYNKRERPHWDMLATVGTLPFYPAGSYHGPAETIDGDVVADRNAIGA